MKMNTEQLNNRIKIIDLATTLFYEQGYNKTSFDDIARHCNITKPLITYHFGTKANLAKEIVHRYSTEIKNHVTERIYQSSDHYNLQYSTVAEIILNMRLYNEDEKALRFYLEYMNIGFEVQFTEDFSRFYKIHDRQYHLKIDRSADELSMLSTAAMFSNLSLLYAYFTGRLKCNFDQFCDYTARIPFQFMKIEEEKVDEIIVEGKKIIAKLDFKILPYFKVY